MTHAPRISKLEDHAAADPAVRRISEARKPRRKIRVLTLRDNRPAPPNKTGNRTIVVRVITTGSGKPGATPPQMHYPGLGRQSTAVEPEKGGSRPTTQARPEKTLEDLRTELGRLEAEERELLRRHP